MTKSKKITQLHNNQDFMRAGLDGKVHPGGITGFANKVSTVIILKFLLLVIVYIPLVTVVGSIINPESSASIFHVGFLSQSPASNIIMIQLAPFILAIMMPYFSIPIVGYLIYLSIKTKKSSKKDIKSAAIIANILIAVICGLVFVSAIFAQPYPGGLL